MHSLSAALRYFLSVSLCCAALLPTAFAGTLYSTGFETFTAGTDTIVNSNGWSGTSSSLGRSGIDSEATHLAAGLGQAGWLGGSTTSAPPGITSFNVRRHIPDTNSFYDPLARNTEIVTITALVGILDSDTSTSNRDRFELYIGSGTLPTIIAAIEFDNATKDTSGNVQQLVRRSVGTPGIAGINPSLYTNTSSYFLYEKIHQLYVRINFRTNRWTAVLDDAFLFLDEVFYLGTTPRNLGAVGFRVAQGSGGSPWNPGTNYMLFDDLTVQADALEAPAITALTLNASGTASLKWTTEYGYRYNVYSSENLSTWSLLTTTPLSGYSTGASPAFLDYTAGIFPEQFYRVKRISP
jgi:hypothetical protein